MMWYADETVLSVVECDMDAKRRVFVSTEEIGSVKGFNSFGEAFVWLEED